MAAARVTRVLFLCTGNSCRSQMAEGWARALHAGAIEPSSAGTEPCPVNRLAVRAMAEVGVDISSQVSRSVNSLSGPSPDVVVTVCDAAQGQCPALPGHVRTIHAGFDDPPRLSREAQSDEEAMPHFRRVRDEIRRFVETLPARLNPTDAESGRPSKEPMLDAESGRGESHP